MQIIERTLSELRPYPGNPRKNEAAVEGVAESIRRFGFKQPLVVDPEGVIVCGHTRYLAAKRLGLATVPCVCADDLTEAELRAYRILDNKLQEKTLWDLELLRAELGAFEFDFQPFDVTFEFPSFDDERKSDGAKGSNDDAIPRSFQLIVECDDEETQQELYERLVDEGFRTRICNL